jgi:phosphoribosylanthranilate isomerase
MIIQIYAFTQIDQAVEAAELGVDQIGFVAGDYGMVPGELSFRQAAQMAEALRGKAVSSALTMSTDLDEILRMVEIVQPDIVHISTDTEAVGVEALEKLRKKLPATVRIMKAIHVAGDESIALAQKFAPVSDLILLDTKVDGMPGVGATGRTHDWEISRRIVTGVSVPVILAGGLSAENVVPAMRAVSPWGVDSNTHTNLAGDATAKDMRRVRQFVEAVRKAEKDLVGRSYYK